MASGQSAEDLDFASVQRDNPGDGAPLPGSDRPLLATGDDNPIVFIHDVGRAASPTPCRSW